ncbi:MAG TPA: hypothetical protein VHZ03_01850 [Trebonia sp.]|nr:hypothetical protein [Trebonia sp.]
MADRDVLAGDRVDHRDGVPLAQTALGVGVFARPPVCHREPVRVEVPGDQVRAGPRRVRRTRGKTLPDLLQLRGELLPRDGLALLPLAVLKPDRPPPAAFLPGRVDGDPEVQFDDVPVAPGGGAGLDDGDSAGCPRLRGGRLAGAAALTATPATRRAHRWAHPTVRRQATLPPATCIQALLRLSPARPDFLLPPRDLG